MSAYERYSEWLASPDVDDKTKQELLDVKDNMNDLIDRFYTELEFGTAGLRGVLGAGDNRMNIYVVRKATEGVARWLDETVEHEKKVVIAYDSRHMSNIFAKETACVLAAHGVKVFLFETLHSVPQLSFSVRYLGCDAGVVITASHNPPKYNGYKVYGRDGGQVDPDNAAAITAKIRESEDFRTAYMDFDEAVATGAITLIGEAVDRAYYDAVKTLLNNPELLREKGGELSMVYTPLHGSGMVPVTTLLGEIGITKLTVVPSQAQPDGDFPTVSAPNPENPEAFEKAIVLANRVRADVILATDPDSDRLGVAARKRDGSFAILTGNQIGSILVHYILSAKRDRGELPKDGLVVRSLVSTRLADNICKAFGVQMREVMTGFRFISECIEECERNGTPTFLFGFEESYGFLAGGFSRDKDAISSAMLIAEACCVYRQRGMTLYDALEEIYREYGYYKEKVKSYTLEGKAGTERITETMDKLRAQQMSMLGGSRITKIEDFRANAPEGMPKSNVLRYTLDKGGSIVVRPSGTEPKLKLYISAVANNEQAVDTILDEIMQDADHVLGIWLYGGAAPKTEFRHKSEGSVKGEGLYFD